MKKTINKGLFLILLVCFGLLVKKQLVQADTIINFGFTPGSIGWFQTEDMDVFSQGNLTSKIPSVATDPYFSLPGIGGSPGLVAYGGQEADFTPGEVSVQGWLANSAYRGKIFDYQYLINRLKINTSEAMAVPTTSSPTESGNYYSASGVTVTTAWNIAGGDEVLVFVNGDLTFEENVTVAQGSFLAVFASGNVTFTGEVTNAEGIFVASGNIVVANLESGNSQFFGEGSFIGWQGFQLNRSLTEEENLTTPALVFSNRPDFWINFPPDITYSLTYREELLP